MERLRVGLEWFLNPDHVPFLLGLQQGWFAEAGLDVELVAPTEHLDAFEAIDRGTLDVAITEPLHLIADRAAGHPVVGFTRFLHTNGGVMYLKGRGITRPRDMAGLRVQYPGAPGPGGKAIVSTMIAADGGTCDPDALTPVNAGFHHTDALLDDRADVATLAFYNFELVEARHRGADAAFFALKDWGVPDFCQLVLFTSEAILTERAEALRRFLTVLSRGLDTLQQQPELAWQAYLEGAEGAEDDALTRAIYDATVGCFTFDPDLSPAYWQRLHDWMLKTGQIDTALPDPAAVWSSDRP